MDDGEGRGSSLGRAEALPQWPFGQQASQVDITDPDDTNELVAGPTPAQQGSDKLRLLKLLEQSKTRTLSNLNEYLLVFHLHRQS